LALVLAAAGCGSSGRDDRQQQGSAATEDASTASPSPGPDPIVLRVARTGGIVRAFAYPRLDSAVWTSSDPAPSIARVLAFDEEGGSLAIVDAKGLPARVDLRSGGVSTASRLKLASLSSADGYAIYGINAGAVTRLTPTGAAWPYKPPTPARDVVPQPDGSVLVVGERGGATTVWHVRPPDAKVIDSAVIAHTRRVVRTEIGDRVYFTSDSGLLALRGRDLTAVPAIHFEHAVRALAPTPSGDRLYVATDSSSVLTMVNRYTDKVEEHIELPGPVGDLRMDPLGRYVLARSARAADSAWVVAIGNNHVVGAVRTAWLADLPFVAPDGMVALAQGNDVVFVDGETLAPRRRVANGAKDFWSVILWNGFRPRAAGLDQPVTFRGSDIPVDSSGRPMDSMDSAFAAGAVRPDSGRATPADSAPRPPATAAPAPAGTPATGAAAPRGPGFTVQFASLLSADKAREVAATITADGRSPRVVETSRSGSTIYRVVLGPYTTKAEADRIGRASGKDFWVFEGTP
jgi:cell division septation protein DedD